MNEEEAIVYFKNYIKVKKEVIKERQNEGLNADSRYTQQLEEMVEAFETVLNLLEKKDTLIHTMQSEFERLEDLEDNTDMLKMELEKKDIDIIEAKEANRQLSIELQKKDKIIDLVAETLRYYNGMEQEQCFCIDICGEKECDMKNCKNRIKQYYERKVEE